MSQEVCMTTMTRREALLIAGLGAVAVAASPMTALAQTPPTFPKGAVIRTLFKDYAPEELGGGATLFHEHLSLGPDFGDRFRAAAAAVLTARGESLPANPSSPPPAPPGPDPMPFYPKEVATMSEEQVTHALIWQADEYPAGASGEIGSWDERGRQL
jgi:hypothetical protein